MDVQEDPIYGPLVNQVLDEIEGMVNKKQKNMRGRQAWMFVTSPGGTTPYHRDQETAHFLHIKGAKKFWLWDKNDKDVVSQEENEFFHGVHGLAKTHYTDAKMQKATLYNIEPGDGVYFPYTAPHMVQNNDDEYSISFSVTYMTDEDFAERRINKINQMLRKFGIKPRAQNISELADSAKLSFHWFLRNIAFRFSPNWKDV